METVSGYRLYCPACEKPFVFCKRCYRGNRYCSVVCASAANKKNRREASIRYQQSKKGRRNHSKCQRDYLARVKNKTLVEKQNTLNGEHTENLQKNRELLIDKGSRIPLSAPIFVVGSPVQSKADALKGILLCNCCCATVQVIKDCRALHNMSGSYYLAMRAMR